MVSSRAILVIIGLIMSMVQQSTASPSIFQMRRRQFIATRRQQYASRRTNEYPSNSIFRAGNRLRRSWGWNTLYMVPCW